MTQTGDRTGLAAAKDLFARERLPFPPVPERFARRLQPFGSSVFTTRELEHGPYAMGVLVAEALERGPVSEYAVIGFDGYGIESWAVHHVLVQRGLALFVQLPWGGVHLDRDEARQAVTDGLSFADSLQGAFGRALDKGRVPDGDRLVVSISGFDGSGWGWVRTGARESSWHEGHDAVGGVTKAVGALFAGAG